MKADKTALALAGCAIAVWALFLVLGGGARVSAWASNIGAAGAAKKLVAHDLLDPSSAQFREVHKTNQAVCGEVNGKNAYGAYVGFKHFIVDANNVTLEPDIPTARLQIGISQAATDEWSAYMDFSGVWLMRCQSALPDLPAAIQPDTSRIDKWIKAH